MLHVDIEPLKALQIYYGGERLGVWRGDIISAEKKRKLFLPPMLQEFLLGYGRLAVNTNSNSYCFPNPGLMNITDEDLVIFGCWDSYMLLAFRRIDFAEANPELFYANCQYYDDSEAMDDEYPRPAGSDFVPAQMRLRDFLVQLVIGNLRKAIYLVGSREGNTDVPPELWLLLAADNLPPCFICWDDESDELWAVSRLPDQPPQRVYNLTRRMQHWELKECFKQAFFQKQDFTHALKLARPLLENLEHVQRDTLELADMYKLAGRCCEELHKWDEGERFYQKAEVILQKKLEEMLDITKNFYQSLGNFYAAQKNEPKSQQAYGKMNKICEFVGLDGVRSRGIRLVQQAINLVGKDNSLCDDLPALREALELYNQALSVYQQEPKECKYDIARCQQLRGDLRKHIKQLVRQKTADNGKTQQSPG